MYIELFRLTLTIGAVLHKPVVRGFLRKVRTLLLDAASVSDVSAYGSK